MKRCRSYIRLMTVILLFLLAAGLVGYPFLSNYLFENRTDSLVNTVIESLEEENDAEKEKMRRAAQAYNEMILRGYVQQKTSLSEMMQASEMEPYQSLLNASEEGVMGVVEIPEIGVRLPIYHGTDAEVLEKGAGHLQGTSLPVGGAGTHTVLTGHTGLSSAKLFTDLTDMEEGDMFYLHVLGERLVYEVNQIRTVLPTDMKDLYVESGKDYCTLLTCTPYGANTHRLLVRGVRCEGAEIPVQQEKRIEEQPEQSQWIEAYRQALVLSLAVFVTGLLILFLWIHYRNRYGEHGCRKKRKESRDSIKRRAGRKQKGRRKSCVVLR